MLRDAPSAFGPYAPENFDGRFQGPISAEDALIRSRNIPAVWVATQLKQPTLYQFLRTAGVRDLRPAEFYGLALAARRRRGDDGGAGRPLRDARQRRRAAPAADDERGAGRGGRQRCSARRPRS